MKATSLYKSPPIDIYLELAQIALRNGHGEAAIEHAMEVCGFRAPHAAAHPPWMFAAACMCARRLRPGRCESTRPRQSNLHVVCMRGRHAAHILARSPAVAVMGCVYGFAHLQQEGEGVLTGYGYGYYAHCHAGAGTLPRGR